MIIEPGRRRQYTWGHLWQAVQNAVKELPPVIAATTPPATSDTETLALHFAFYVIYSFIYLFIYVCAFLKYLARYVAASIRVMHHMVREIMASRCEVNLIDGWCFIGEETVENDFFLSLPPSFNRSDRV